MEQLPCFAVILTTYYRKPISPTALPAWTLNDFPLLIGILVEFIVSLGCMHDRWLAISEPSGILGAPKSGPGNLL